MAVPNDTIEKALRMLGYKNPSQAHKNWGAWHEVSSHHVNSESGPNWTIIPTDLASVLKRCKEQGFIYNFDADHLGFVRVRLVHNRLKIRVLQGDGYPDELDAVLLALAAAWDAKEK